MTKRHLNVLHKSIVPKEVKRGSEVTVFCDSDLAGVPENGSPEGIFALELSWNNEFHYSFSTTYGTGITIGVNTHWRTRVSGHYPRNSRGLFDRDKFRLELDMINITPDDQGEFCCCSFISKNGRMQQPPAKRCEDFIVTDQSILEPSENWKGSFYKRIQCTSKLAGIPDTATEMENVSLFWQNKDFDPNSYFFITLSSYGNVGKHPVMTKRMPSGKHRLSWTIHNELVKPNDRMDKDGARLLLVIGGLNTEDIGWYCCSVTYFDEADAKRLAYRCHYLSASLFQAIHYSTNGSSIKIVTENLIFGMLIFSWALLHFYRSE
ncbi:uncharacterized protein LOC131937880 isoform X2 [Physella acuta]|uniref:uncharacterized protein LOC131937880 isoform X2 n=1 Tax=Physella acuta TaxID=109671 RepID=UPI0027DB3260|nr:uncharacterized protein LOC131937880 isoform X2 [Physella acuta]